MSIMKTISLIINQKQLQIEADPVMAEGIGEQAYETSYVRADYHMPVAAWRSVTSSTLPFSHECFIEELAHKAARDPPAFRLAMLTKDSDTKRVLFKLKEVGNWTDLCQQEKQDCQAQYNAERVTEIAEKKGVPNAQIALAWMLIKSVVTTPII